MGRKLPFVVFELKNDLINGKLPHREKSLLSFSCRIMVLIKLAIDHFKDFYMSTKRLEQAAQTTKQHLFSWSGFTKVGMLAELAEQFSVVRDTFAEASAALGFDLWQIAQSGEGLDQTENTQPVLLTASIALMACMVRVGGVAPKNIWLDILWENIVRLLQQKQ